MITGCKSEEKAVDPCTTDGALSTCLAPTQTPEYYIDQSLRYFDTLDASADPDSHPTYSTLVARWEWPPWLKLTGYGAELTATIDEFVLVAYPETTVPIRECEAFDVQPFGRCRVSFDYSGQACPIFEEFTFNDAGEMTFIEAWSDLPGLGPTDDTSDTWAEGAAVHRLSTRIPGLGTADGLIDPSGEPMINAGQADAEVEDFRVRALDFWDTWLAEYEATGEDVFAAGCGWDQ